MAYLKNGQAPAGKANTNMAPGCAGCGFEIEENTPFIIDKDGYNFHPECFRCCRCGDIIPDSQYKPSKDGPICLSCGLPQCAECMNLIVGDLIVATHVDGTPYSFHTQCLKCVQCGLSITDKYKATEDGFKCTNCESPVCSGCGKVIAGGSQYYLDQDTYMAQCGGCYRTRQQCRLAQPQALPGVQQMQVQQNIGRPTMQLITKQDPFMAGQPNVQRIVLPAGGQPAGLPQQQIVYR